jgi:hypothetical protein
MSSTTDILISLTSSDGICYHTTGSGKKGKQDDQTKFDIKKYVIYS